MRNNADLRGQLVQRESRQWLLNVWTLHRSGLTPFVLTCLVTQVLANPSADVQESPAVSKADLKQRGIRPYDEKVGVSLLTCIPVRSWSFSAFYAIWT